MSDSFGIGIVGAGTIGNVHAMAIQALDRARVVAVSDPREDAGRVLAEAHGATWVASVEDLLETPGVDIVVLTTPSGLHADQAVLAAEAGKHIITEKPMAITRKSIDRMVAAASSCGVEMAVIFQNRFSRDILKVKRAIEAGMIGRPIIGNASVHWHRTDEYYAANGGWRGTWELDGGGALMNQSIHTIDLVQWLMGGVASISADIATITHNIETEDTATASIAFRSGGLGTIQGTTSASKDWPVRVEIVGTGGRVTIEAGVVTAWEGDSPLTDDLLLPIDREFSDGWAPDEPFGAAHRRQISLILDALAVGDVPPVPPREARKAVDIILGIYDSAKSGQRVAIS